MSFKIGNRRIGPDLPPLVIAEMSGNHNQSLARALAIVDAAAEAGAHALKLQTYTADTITLNVRGGDFEIRDKGSLWAGQNLHDLYAKAHTLGVARADHGAGPPTRHAVLQLSL